MKVLVIGAGKMGFSIISAWKKSKLVSVDVHILEKSKKRRIELKKKFTKAKIYSKATTNWKGDLLVLSIKPQIFKLVANDISKKNIKSNSVLSIMAGIKIKQIERELKVKSNIIRLMPNIAAELGLSANSIYHSKNISKYHLNKVQHLIKILGNTYSVKTEKMIDAVTAITGSGPAYFFLFLLVYEQIAQEMGFGRKISKQLIFDTALGSIELVKKQGNIRDLIKSVTSKGGTTAAALKILEKKNSGLYEILKKAIIAANNKAKQLSKT